MEYIKRKLKFTDDEFLEYYNQGLSDGNIGIILKCVKSNVRYRRAKLNLIANFKNFIGERNNKEEIKKGEERRRKHNKEYYQILEVKEKEKRKKQNKEYEQRPEIKERRRKYKKEYYQNKKLK